MAVAGASGEARITSSASRAPATSAESSCPVAVTVKTFSRVRSTRTPRFCRTRAPATDGRGETARVPAARRRSAGAVGQARPPPALVEEAPAAGFHATRHSDFVHEHRPSRSSLRLTGAALSAPDHGCSSPWQRSSRLPSPQPAAQSPAAPPRGPPMRPRRRSRPASGSVAWRNGDSRLHRASPLQQRGRRWTSTPRSRPGGRVRHGRGGDEPIHDRHRIVHDDDVGADAHLVERCSAVRGLRYDLAATF